MNCMGGLYALPQTEDIFNGNGYVYEFQLQAWALLTCARMLDAERYNEEYQNLTDLADALSEYVEEERMSECGNLLLLISRTRATPCVQQGEGDTEWIANLLNGADRHVYIEIYYRRGVLIGRLQMNMDLGEYGAFGISRGSDLLQMAASALSDGSGGNALDLGSGNGFSTFVLSGMMDSVTGVELNRGLYNESLAALSDLTEAGMADRVKVSFVNADFFDIDFSPYSFIYIYWPYDDKEKHSWEERTRKRLEQKLLTECKSGTIVAVMVPGINEKRLFPALKRLPVEASLNSADDFNSVAELYRV